MKKLTVDMEGLCRYVMPSKDDRTTKHVILYGAGKDLHGYMFELEFISRLLEQKGEVEGNFLDRIATCVDTNPRKQGHRASFAGKEYNVTSPESLHELSRPEDTVVIVTSTRYAWEMENVLHQNFADEGFSYCLAPELNCALGGGRCPSKVFRRLMKSWAEEYDDDDIPMLAEKLLSWLDGEKAIVPDIGIKLTNKCSLNCKHCIDRIPYLPNTDVPIETVKRDLEILLDNAVYVGLLTFVSGEVLVYPHLAEVLKIAVESPKVHKILINTNGTVLPRESSVPYLKSPKCSIYISDYGDLVKMARAVDFYERNGIDILVRTEMKWKPYSAYPEKRGKDIGALKKMFASCSIANTCPPLMSNGRAALCGIAEKFRELGAYTGTKDFFDLAENGKFKENYYRMMDIDYMECCDMCDIVELGNSTEYVTAGEQIDQKKQWHRSGYTISKRYE